MTIDSSPQPPTPVIPAPAVNRFRRPTTKRQQVKAELWAARLGFCGELQLDAITKAAGGLPDGLAPHPFHFQHMKEQANIRRQPSSQSSERLTRLWQRFFMDFGFMRASTDDFSRLDSKRDRMVKSFDRYN